MTRFSISLLTFLLTPFLSKGQSEGQKEYRNFPVVVAIQFHSIAMPFRDIKSNFSNVGFAIGTEVSHNGKQNWVQQLMGGWHHNKSAGNGVMLYTQVAWRLTVASDLFTEAKTGIGYIHLFRPRQAFRLADGKWIPAGTRGKGMLAIPTGVSIGLNPYSARTYISPFVSYQFLIVKGYNASIPLMPQTLIQAGARIHTKK